MASKIIDFGHGVMPKGFSPSLSSCFNLVPIDIYQIPDFTGGTLILFSSEDDYILVTPNRKEHINYRELGRYELLDAIFSKGDYLHSFYIAENIFTNKQDKKVKLIALLYEERGRIHIWNPTFEELFLPLIEDDLNRGIDAHWRGLQEIYQNRTKDLNVYDIVLNNQVDYEIEVRSGLNFNTVVYYALLKHIFLVEDEKYPEIPGADRTLQSYEELYNSHLNSCVNMIKWRQIYNLKNPWV
ncbi:hypothetical protein NQ126_010015 [Priestia megaterium]|uniref:hypothetical protein n=1 Tax=Priestia megaterium TaxID=1404 RepID=UPI0024467B00|nr:hypothetical protein [Priestia megaterium]WRQ94755.1 hypothetical protein NQ126_010015 [Priestia megaterium]